MMRIAIDYRPALRQRSGVGEYVHQLSRALRDEFPGDSLTLFTSSLKDRPAAELGNLVPGARVSDHRIPVQVLNFAWHRLEWPPVEWCLRESCDVAFSPHPLLLPARRAAQVVMVHDLDFMRHPERTHREIRRDYPALAAQHAHRADRVIVPSEHTAGEVSGAFGVDRECIVVCPPGVPEWSSPARGFDPAGYVLFIGTTEPRKNVPALLEASAQLVAEGRVKPRLVLAGRAGSDAERCQVMAARPPLAGRVDFLGYVADAERQRVYTGARVLVLPSLEEGFGMPVLEAMSLGVPVIVSERGGLPALVGDAGLLVDPTEPRAIASALERVLSDDGLAHAMARRGLERAARYSWRRTAASVRSAFVEAKASRALVNRSAARSRTARRRAPETATTAPAAPRAGVATAGTRES
jgi:glycosyltransferase involved in cell wall biosynthesis